MLLSALLFLLLQTELLFLAQSICQNNGNYTINSTYSNNLDTVLSSIPENIDINGFYNASAGQGPDRANAIALCRGDLQPQICRRCIRNLTADLRTACPNQRQAVDWTDMCMLRYSNETMLGTLSTSPRMWWWNTQNATNPTVFMDDLRDHIDNLRGQAAGGGSLMKVAAGNVTANDFQFIFALVQCTPDLSSDECSSCLIDVTADIPRCCDRKRGGRVTSPSCTLRYETYPFYNETRLRELVSVPPAPAPRPPLPPVTPSQLSPPDIDEISTVESLKYSLSTIRAATNDFSDDNQLGQDPVKRSYLDWDKRYKIIGGIARGILYLHEDSQVRIIHRDLKPSNVLLDGAMNPKIADFGMARLFGHDDTQGNTSKIAGTFGYMAPEYAMHGLFSIKSDIFSFGVLVLEIISGQKNNNVRRGETVEDLLSFAWKNWHGRTPVEIVDPCLRSGSGSMNDMVRCIHIALLCVQENAADRPTMASVVLMLNSFSITLGIPSEPAFYMPSDYGSDTSALLQDKNSSNSNVQTHSENGNYNPNSTYSNNLNSLLSSIPENMGTNGFYNASIGRVPDRVNAIALCRGDLQLDTCRWCIGNLTTSLLTACPNEKQAVDWTYL
ncbi:cysteine-rich receptor-like protein kinase 10 [Phtheirospermum japonicum]|uniref:Cysteine-rich receptor-like protein kinase 10 n=1 Tax=Phtheirospermum japonicum TaxID=374723 RepID=A0A830C912_9LAMI|nr:cysteine-rich receptor-like protein kinase 10 [Phtheirospermum japonicum]